MKREIFLIDFLGAYGAQDVVFSQINDSSVSGTAIYDPNDPEERQDFRWDISETDVPSEAVYKLTKLLRIHRLLDVDRLTMARPELRNLYNQQWQVELSVDEFDHVWDELKSIAIKIFDEDGSEGNSYSIHD